MLLVTGMTVTQRFCHLSSETQTRLNTEFSCQFGKQILNKKIKMLTTEANWSKVYTYVYEKQT